MLNLLWAFDRVCRTTTRHRQYSPKERNIFSATIWARTLSIGWKKLVWYFMKDIIIIQNSWYLRAQWSTFKMRKSFKMAFVIACANQNISGKAANHVKMKLKGSGNCIMTTYNKSTNYWHCYDNLFVGRIFEEFWLMNMVDFQSTLATKVGRASLSPWYGFNLKMWNK